MCESKQSGALGSSGWDSSRSPISTWKLTEFFFQTQRPFWVWLIVRYRVDFISFTCADAEMNFWLLLFHGDLIFRFHGPLNAKDETEYCMAALWAGVGRAGIGPTVPCCPLTRTGDQPHSPALSLRKRGLFAGEIHQTLSKGVCLCCAIKGHPLPYFNEFMWKMVCFSSIHLGDYFSNNNAKNNQCELKFIVEFQTKGQATTDKRMLFFKSQFVYGTERDSGGRCP